MKKNQMPHKLWCTVWSLQCLRQACKKLLKFLPLLIASQLANAALTSQANTVDIPREWSITSANSITRSEIHSGKYLSPHRLQSLYENNSYRPLWEYHLEEKHWLDNVRAALVTLEYDGLPMVRYHLDEIDKLRKIPHKHWLLDIYLTDAFVNAVSDLSGELIPAEFLGSKWKLEREASDALGLVTSMRFGKTLASILDALRPTHPQYELLRQAYKDTSEKSSSIVLPPGENIVPGEHSQRVSLLAKRLFDEGLLDTPSTQSIASYDARISNAVKVFQSRRGLQADGVVGAETLAALNESPKNQALTIALNLQRWRSAPQQFTSSYVFVNTAAYRMELVEQGQKTLEMDVIVGKHSRQTPSFSDNMTQVQINPYWNIPKRITRETMLPKLRDDPDYALRMNIKAIKNNKVVPWTDIEYVELWADEFAYRLQQRASNYNALGRYKFLFPNPYMVYLHDTPYKRKFSSHKRTFSHGCVRLAQPELLANRLLENNGWDSQRVKRAVKSGKRHIIDLDTPMQIYLMYLTAWVNDAGDLELYPDAYQLDTRLGEFLVAANQEKHNGVRVAQH